VRTHEELAQAWAHSGQVPCVLEKMLPLMAECSVLVARGHDGQAVSYPAQRNVHVDGILAVTHAYPGCLPADLAERAQAATRAIAQQIGYVGLLCVEFFVVQAPQGLELVVNEMAPRPHNSGHHTIDAFDHSQFDLQVRAMTGLPLPIPRQHSPAIMLNLLGDIWFDAQGRERSPDWAQLLSLPGTHLHLYGKTQARRGRKMGHLTLTGPDLPAVQSSARRCAELLGLPGLA
jgi:5-(carboxyamino)imidazole ribonucleotide synthase